MFFSRLQLLFFSWLKVVVATSQNLSTSSTTRTATDSTSIPPLPQISYSATNPHILTEVLEYTDEESGGTVFKAFVATNIIFTNQRPAVLVIPDWNGRDEYENNRTVQLAELGYVGFAVDIYGNGTVGRNPKENTALMTPFLQNRTKFIHRIQIALAKVKTLDNVDISRIAAIGYCFGGLGVLDLARHGDKINGVVSFHGNLSPPPTGTPKPEISAKILVQTGFEDPSVPPEMVRRFEDEMKSRNADWHLVSYGNTYHSFTVPNTNVPGRAVYNPVADRRSWSVMHVFFKELFDED